MKRKLFYFVFLVLIVSLLPIISFADSKTNGNNNENRSGEAVDLEIPEKQKNEKDSYTINSLTELKEEINRSEAKGEISKERSKNILEKTEPEVIGEYLDYIDNEVSRHVNSSEPDEISYDPVGDKTTETYIVNIDGISHAEVIITDQEEISPTKKLVSTVESKLGLYSYAATNGETMWKSYNKDGSKKARYFTAKYKRWIGPGYGNFCTENHYYVSSKGIQERYGSSWVESFIAITVEVTGKKHTIEDEWAKNAGEDAHIKTRWDLKQTIALNGVNTYHYSTIYERTKIKYLQKDSANHRIKVKHSWEKIS